MMNQHTRTTDMLHALVAVEAELCYVTAMLKLHLTRAQDAGDAETIARINHLLTA